MKFSPSLWLFNTGIITPILSHFCCSCRMMSYYASLGNQLEGSLWTYKYKPKKATEVRYLKLVSFLYRSCYIQFLMVLNKLTSFPFLQFLFKDEILFSIIFFFVFRSVVMMKLWSFWVIGYIFGMQRSFYDTDQQ